MGAVSAEIRLPNNPANDPPNDTKWLAVCGLLIIGALVVGVGSVSHDGSREMIQHLVQTAPLWLAIVPAAYGSGWSKWAALPCFVFWLLLMTAIWLFLLGWAHIVSGTFTHTEIVMTLIVGVASVAGIASALRMRGEMSRWLAALLVIIVAALQLSALRLSLLPQIAHR